MSSDVKVRVCSVGLAIALSLLGCAPSDHDGVTALPVNDECYDQRDGVLCSEERALTCAGGRVAARESCSERALMCVTGVGCRACTPYAFSCDGARRLQCDPRGEKLELVEQCPPELDCSAAGCRDLCADAARDRSYLGCDYFPVFTSNRKLSPQFQPAVSIGNGNLVAAEVVISRLGSEQRVEVAPRSALTVTLAFDPALKASEGSLLLPRAAYHLTSSVPVTVHQFNPLSFQVERACTTDELDQGVRPPCYDYSFTNDASLLLPASALGPALDEPSGRVTFLAASRASYMARNAHGYGTGPGFIAVVGASETKVNVRIRTRAYTQALSELGGEDATLLAPGDTLERTLLAGDVLQLLSAEPSSCTGRTLRLEGREVCDPGADYDLTGSEISADGPIQVISGHDCANVPAERWACDHLEESMVPVRTWGTSAVVTCPSGFGGGAYVMRIVSGEDGNSVQFDPPIAPPFSLARGEYREFSVRQPVFVSASKRLMIAQFLLGQGEQDRVAGDPSLSLAVPVDQYRTSYDFVSPGTYAQNLVDIVATEGDVVTLDGKVVSGFAPVGDSAFRVASVELREAGAHALRSSSAAGVGMVLYGYGDYTSYMLPGGLDLAPLGVPGI